MALDTLLMKTCRSELDYYTKRSKMRLENAQTALIIRSELAHSMLVGVVDKKKSFFSGLTLLVLVANCSCWF
jgi:hypothetical protein